MLHLRKNASSCLNGTKFGSNFGVTRKYSEVCSAQVTSTMLECIMHSLRESSRQQRGRGSWILEEECRSSTLTVRLAIEIKITRHEPSLLPGPEP